MADEKEPSAPKPNDPTEPPGDPGWSSWRPELSDEAQARQDEILLSLPTDKETARKMLALKPAEEGTEGRSPSHEESASSGTGVNDPSDGERRDSSVIGRAEARALAAAALREIGEGRSIGQVVRLSELGTAAPRLWDLEIGPHHWIAFLESSGDAIQSSTIAVIDDRSGEVVHVGSAQDEG